MKRNYNKFLECKINTSVHLTGEALRNNQAVGFFESERPDITRYTAFTPDGEIKINLRGLSPKNEQDSDMVCKTLVSVINARGLRVKLEGSGKQDEDFVLTVNGARVGVQVVRALTDPRFWRELARSGEVGDLIMTVSEAASALRTAIEHKTGIPPQQRPNLLLLLDAYRLPHLALGPVADQFKREQAIWAQSLGFYAVYVVGPTGNFVSRLDEQDTT
jgi:hypothetical protein